MFWVRKGGDVKASEWQRTLQRYREQYRKVLFTPAELANIAGQSMPVLKNSLHSLRRQGVFELYAQGKYGLPGAVLVEDLVVALDASAYITGMYALYNHGLLNQTPQRIHVFTNRRHNRSRVRKTKFGTIILVCVQGTAYALPDGSAVAGPEQSLCDFVYLLRRRGLLADSLVSFRELQRLDMEEMQRQLSRYPKTVELEVNRLVSK